MEPGNLPTLTAECLLAEEMGSLSLQLLLLRGKTACLKEKLCTIVSIARAKLLHHFRNKGALYTIRQPKCTRDGSERQTSWYSIVVVEGETHVVEENLQPHLSEYQKCTLEHGTSCVVFAQEVQRSHSFTSSCSSVETDQ